MTDHNRGAYTPQSEAPLAFDARRSPAERPFPMALVISAAILAIIVVALVVFLMRQPDGSESPAESGEVIDAMKIEPAQPLPTLPAPGMQVAVEDPLAAPSFTPPPEQPAARPAPIAAAPAPAAPADPLSAVMPKAAPAPAPAPVVAAAPKAPAPSAAPKAAPTPAGSSGAQVQIGAFSSASLAEKGWNDVAGMFPGQMAGKTKRVEQVEADGATLHRAFVGGFASRADAQAFCESLKARGRACLVR